MAIQKSISTPDGVEHPEAYLRVIAVHTQYKDKFATVFAEIYHNKQARLDDKTPIVGGNIQFSVRNNVGEEFDAYFADIIQKEANSTPVEKAYLLIKTKEEYSDWIDV